MGRIKYWTPGNYVEIPISKGRYCYGVVTDAGHLAIMDYCNNEKLSSSKIELLPILFEVPVMKYGIGKNGWSLAGKVKVSEKFRNYPHFYKKDAINGKLSIVDTNFMNGVPATKEECENLECAAVWDPVHLEERLNEFYKLQ